MNDKFPRIPQDKKVILFDGVCNFCNFWVNYIIDHDKKDLFLFATLQSEYGKAILKKINITNYNFETLVLIDDQKYYLKSTAALLVVKNISGWLKIFYPFIILPETIRDLFYSIIAKRRYNIFGKKDFCRIPADSEKVKFLE